MPSSLRSEVAAIILGLKDDPYPPNSAALRRDLSHLRKIRIDGWRIIYQVKETDQIVIIREIRPRDAHTYLNL
jgi:mRNA-degrading endonuclease RelE of RelBE toxin-antitoxin system